MSYGDPGGLLFMNDGLTPAQWYESADLTIPNNVAGLGSNTVTVVGRKKPGTLNSSKARIQGYICNVGFTMKPGNTPYTQFIGKVDIEVTDLDNAGPATGVTATLPPLTITALPANPTQAQKDDALGPGHRCLIGRIFPLGVTPPANQFTPMTEDHECQHNIDVVDYVVEGGQMAGGAGSGTPGDAQIGPNKNGQLEFRLEATTIGAKAEQVTLRVTSPFLTPRRQKRLTELLRERRDFRGISKEPAPSFGFDFDIPREELPQFEHVTKNGKDVQVKSKKPFVPKVGKQTKRKFKEGVRVQVPVDLRPGKTARVAFVADLRKLRLGLAQVFEFEQIGANGKPQGGLTLLVHRRV